MPWQCFCSRPVFSCCTFTAAAHNVLQMNSPETWKALKAESSFFHEQSLSLPQPHGCTRVCKMLQAIYCQSCKVVQCISSKSSNNSYRTISLIFTVNNLTTHIASSTGAHKGRWLCEAHGACLGGAGAGGSLLGGEARKMAVAASPL